MKRVIRAIVVVLALCSSSNASTALFDFNSGPQFSSLPLSLTVDGITAHFSSTGNGFSIQNTAQVIGVLPAGFTGLGLTPNGVLGGDLLVDFPNETATDFSIMVAPQELATDTTATLKVSAYLNGNLVGTNTSAATGDTFTWPSSTLSFSSAQGFNSVVIHYQSPPPGGGDYGVIFVADNMSVTATAVPEPCSLTLVAMGVFGLIGLHWRSFRKLP